MAGPREQPRRSATDINDSTGRLKRHAERMHRDSAALVRRSRVILARTTAAIESSRLVLRQAWSATDGVVRGNGYHGTTMTMPNQSEHASIPLGTVSLEADLTPPAGDRGLVVFAHGSGSSRHSPRNRYVARVLERAGLGTLLVDLLTVDEEQADLAGGELRFDIPLLAERLTGIIDWTAARLETGNPPIGLFGASTGAAAALIAAAERPDAVRTVVSRGGRPDLAGDALASVQAPVLLIVGGRDRSVLDLNRQAMRKLRTHSHLEIVLGATHLFEEEGALERVAWLAKAWFLEYAGAESAPSRAGD